MIYNLYLASLRSHSEEGEAFGPHTRTLLGLSEMCGSAAAGACLLCQGPISGPTSLILAHLQALAPS